MCAKHTSMRKQLVGMLLLLTSLAGADQPLVLVIGDLNQVQVSVRESKLRQRLKELRDSGQLDARLAGYNLALSDHRKSLKSLGVTPTTLPMLLVCSQTDKGLPLAVEWSTTTADPEAAVGELLDFLGEEAAPTDPSPAIGTLSMDEPSIQVGGQSGVINVKVRLSNAGASTLPGPLKVLLWTQLPGQEWTAAGEQSMDKLPTGWNVTKDFFIVEAGELLSKPFHVKAQVKRGTELLQEKTAARSLP